MSIENTLSTIRKAVKGHAEEIAKLENLEFPENRHYKDAFNYFKFIKEFEPEMFEKAIKIGARAKELKDLMGVEKYKLLNEVLEGITEFDLESLTNAKEYLIAINSKDKISQELEELNQRFIKHKLKEIEQDSRIIKEFKGQMDLLKKAYDFLYLSMLDIINSYSINQKLTPINIIHELNELFVKLIKFLRNVD